MIARFVRFDVMTLVTTQPARALFPLLFVIVFTATLPVPGLGILIGALVASVTASVPFQTDERGHLDVLYGTAPLRRSSIVTGRYTTLLIFAAIAIGIGTVTSLIIAALQNRPLPGELMGTMLLAAFACISLSYAIQIPLFFARGYTRGRPMIYIPVGIIAIGGFVAGQTGLLNEAQPALTTGLPLTVIVGVASAAAVILILSAISSIRVYQRREL